MPNKSFSIYRSKESAVADPTDELVLEVAKTHVACISKKRNSIISAFELFNYTESEAVDFSKLFSTISADSMLLDKSYATTKVFINNELNVLVPIFKFDQEIASDYLEIMFGEDADYKMQFEHLPIEPGIINVYRIGEQVLNVLEANLANVTFKHTCSNIIKTVISDISVFPAEFIYVQFYNTFIILTVLKDGKLQLIQSFVYEAPEDVLYYLLNITQQFKLSSENLVLQISGMIDLNFTLYRDLITYYAKVEVQNVDTLKSLPEIKEYPLHYFTPFFNLAL